MAGFGPSGLGYERTPFAVQHHQRPRGQRAHRRGIPAGGNESLDPAARFGDIHHGGRVGVRAGHVEPFSIGAERQRRGCHPQRLPRRHGHVDALHHAQLVPRADRHRVHVVGIGRRHEQARRPGGFAFRGFRGGAVPPHDIGGVGADAHGLEHAAAGRVIVPQRAIGPMGHEERLAVGMEQDAIRPPPGLVALDHHSRLRIDHHHGIAVQVGRVEQAAIGRKRHVADEIAVRALVLRNHGKRARRRQFPAGEAEFKHRRARSAAHIHAVALGCEGESQPGVGHRHARRPRARRPFR